MINENTSLFSNEEIKQFWENLKNENLKFYEQLINNIPDLQYNVLCHYDDYEIIKKWFETFDSQEKAEEYALSQVNGSTNANILKCFPDEEEFSYNFENKNKIKRAIFKGFYKD